MNLATPAGLGSHPLDRIAWALPRRSAESAAPQPFHSAQVQPSQGVAKAQWRYRALPKMQMV